MNPCARVRLPNVFQGILMGKAHTVLLSEEASGSVRSMGKPIAQRRDLGMHSCNSMGPVGLSQMLVR